MFETYSQIFSKRASEYHCAMRLSPRARDAEFLAVLEPIRDLAPGLVCDMPSGGGYLADYLWPGMDYLAIDPAAGFFVEWTKPLQRLSSEITSVPLASECVDYVVSLAGLHHEPDLSRVFDEMHRLLRTGGRLVLADVAVETTPAKFLNGFVAANCPLGHDGRFLDENCVATLERAGFSIIDDRMINVPWAFDSLAEVGEFCRNLFGLTDLNAEETTAAMECEIGFDFADGAPRLRWVLRRIVADAI